MVLFYVAISSTCQDSCGGKNEELKEHRQRRIKVKTKAVLKIFYCRSFDIYGSGKFLRLGVLSKRHTFQSNSMNVL